MRSLQQFWSVRRIGDDRVTLARLGPLRLWLARAEKEWGWACEHGDNSEVMDIAQVPDDVLPEKLEWTKTLFAEAPREFHLQPAVPDRPVVVKPEQPVLIPDGESGLFFACIPVVVEIILAAGKRKLVLGRVPSRRMSDTWFGLPVAGEFCYSLPGPARQEAQAIEPFPHLIVCPLEIQNRSGEVLNFEKLCLRPEYMALYCGAVHLWASRVRIQHEGAYRGTSIRYVADPPDQEPNLARIAAPLKREDRGLSRLTFSPGFSGDVIFGR